MPKVFFSWRTRPNGDDFTGRVYKLISELEDETKNNYDPIKLVDSGSGNLGSGEIPENLWKNLSASDIFIADLTRDREQCGSSDRLKPCNENVLFETGAATALLGSQRVILIVDQGTSEKMPFDLRSRLHFVYTPEKGIEELKNRILQIVENDPEKPVLVVDEQRILRHDAHNMKRFLSVCDLRNLIDSLEQYYDTPPKLLMDFEYSYMAIRDSITSGFLEAAALEKVVQFYKDYDRLLGAGVSIFHYDGAHLVVPDKKERRKEYDEALQSFFDTCNSLRAFYLKRYLPLGLLDEASLWDSAKTAL